MLKLHGFAVSNYFNMVKLALLEKGVDFEVVEAYPNQDSAFLSRSPMGKVPVLETEAGFISETNVILDYIEDSQGGTAFYPEDAFARAQVKELMKEVELYIELPARRCYGEVFFGGKASDETKQQSLADLKKGIKAFKSRAKFSPYIAGDAMTYADIVFMYSIGLANIVSKQLFSVDLLEEFPQAKAALALLAEREHAKTVDADLQAAMVAFKARQS